MKRALCVCLVVLVCANAVPLPDDAVIAQNLRKDEARIQRQIVRIYPGGEDDADERFDLNNRRPLFVPNEVPTKRPPQPPRRGFISRIVTSVLNSSRANSRKDASEAEKAPTDQRTHRQTKVEVSLDDDEQKLDEGASAEKLEEDANEEEEPPGGGDGQGGGLLGLLAGLSGDDGQSDLGSLLTAAAGIVTNLSGGPDFDLNQVIASTVALFGGLFGGDGSQNIGTTFGQYFNTGFNGITGGGAMKNGAFVGNLLATLIYGSSGPPVPDSSEEVDTEVSEGTDSTAFFISLLGALFGGK